MGSLTANAGYPFSTLEVTLTQGSKTGTLQLTNWSVTTDAHGKAQGSVDFGNPAYYVSGMKCAELAAGTPFDVKLTATLPGGATAGGTTQHTFPLYTITVDPVAEGTVTCDPTVGHGGDAKCSITNILGDRVFDTLDIVDDPAGTATVSCNTSVVPIVCTIANVTGNVKVRGVFKRTHRIDIVAATGGDVKCAPNPVPEGVDAVCNATNLLSGYTFDTLDILDDPAGTATVSCTGAACTLSGVTGNVRVQGVFKAPPAPSGATAVPTMSDIWLLLSSLALAGAATPALRRRKRAKKTDTCNK